MTIRWVIMGFFLLGLLSCGGSSNRSSCAVPEQNQVWFNYLKDWYLWYGDLPASIDPQSYASPAAMLAAIKSDQDRFSYIQTRADYDAFFNSGTFFGYGFSMDREMFSGSFAIRYVFSNSGAEAAGLTRGSRLTVINGHTVTDIVNNNLDNATVFGPDEQGYTISVTYLTPDGNEVTADMVKGTVTTNTVFATEILDTMLGKVGYLAFQHGFIEPSEAELETAFATLAAENPGRLILDLRYNGGGRISIAQLLGSLIGGSATSGSVFGTLEYNDKHQSSNSTYSFTTEINQLNLTQLIVLTTDSTCSASEMIINGLDPHIDVITIGTTTCGKPIGMSPQEYCDMVMSAINFKVVNSEGYGDYFDGIASQCTVSDSIVADWSDVRDPIYAEALYYAANNSCSTQAAKQFEPYKAPSQRKRYQAILQDHLH